MSCQKEHANLEEAKGELASAEEAYDRAWTMYLAAMASAALHCTAAGSKLGLDPISDGKCALSIVLVKLAGDEIDRTAWDCGIAEFEVENAQGELSSCLENCPSWAWKAKR